MAEKIQALRKPGPQMIPVEDTSSLASIKIKVEGLSPLLTHNPSNMTAEVGAKAAARIPTPQEEAERGTYQTESGAYAIPGVAFRGSLLKVASGFKPAGSKGKRTAKFALSHLTVSEMLIPLEDPETSEPLTKYEIDTRRVLLQGKNGVARSRPRFDKWAATVTFSYDPTIVGDPRLIVEVLQEAGKMSGVGDYRPEKNGPFGRYRVVGYWLAD